MMRVIKEWQGAHNSTLYLQDWCFDDGLKHLTILYCYSLVGDKYESSNDFRVEDLNNAESALVRLIQSDFNAECYEEIRQNVKAYFADKEITNL